MSPTVYPELATLADLRLWLLPQQPAERAIIHLSPTLADVLLKTQRTNRTLSDGLVQAYCDDMHAGAFPDLHPECVLYFDTNGRMADGQHRCAAVKKANIVLQVFAERSLTEDQVALLNQGRARTIGDSIVILGDPLGARKAQIITGIIKYELANNRKVTKNQYDIAVARLGSAHLTAVIAAAKAKTRVNAAVAGALVLAHPLNPNKIELLTTRLATRELLPGTEAAIGRAIVDTRHHGTTFEKACKGILAYLKGETKEKLYAGSEGYAALMALRARAGLPITVLT